MRHQSRIAAIVIGGLFIAIILLFFFRTSPPISEGVTTQGSEETLLPANADRQGTPARPTLTSQTESASGTTTMAVMVTPVLPAGEGVIVVTDKQQYTVGEAILVTIANRLSTPIATVNQQAFCTTVRMETQENGTWQEVKNCFSGEPAVQVTIDPGSSRVEQLSAYAAGTYRVGLVYSEGERYDAGKFLQAFAPAFDVNGS